MARPLRKLSPDSILFRRRAAGEPLRDLARDYGVTHTTLSRHFARPAAVKQLKRAEQLNRVERRAAEARRLAEEKAERAARRRLKQQQAAAKAVASGADRDDGDPEPRPAQARAGTAASPGEPGSRRARRHEGGRILTISGATLGNSAAAYMDWLDQRDSQAGRTPPRRRH